MTNSPTELQEDDRPPVVTDSPKRIWLVYGDLERDCTHSECDEVTWCSEQQYASDVEYALAADLRRLEADLRDYWNLAESHRESAECSHNLFLIEQERTKALEAENAALRGALNARWHAFDARKGSRQKLPPVRKYVLVRLASSSPGSLPEGIAVGYRKNAAGDKQSPYFVVPGLYTGAALAWCDCLPEGFSWPGSAALAGPGEQHG